MQSYSQNIDFDMIPLVVNSVYNPQENWIGFVQSDGNIEVRDIFSNKLLFRYTDKQSNYTCCSLSDEKSLLIVGLSSGNLQYFDTISWKKRGLLQGSLGNISHCNLSPIGDLLAIVINYQYFILWDVHDQNPIYKQRYQNKIKSTLFSLSGDTFILGFENGTVRIFSLFPIITQQSFSVSAHFKSMQISPDGCVLAIGYLNQIELFTITPLKNAPKISIKTKELASFCFGFNDIHIFYCDFSGCVFEIKVKNNTHLSEKIFSFSGSIYINKIYFNQKIGVFLLLNDGNIVICDRKKSTIHLFSFYPTGTILDKKVPYHCSIAELIPISNFFQVSFTESQVNIGLSFKSFSSISPLNNFYYFFNIRSLEHPLHQKRSPINEYFINLSQNYPILVANHNSIQQKSTIPLSNITPINQTNFNNLSDLITNRDCELVIPQKNIPILQQFPFLLIDQIHIEIPIDVIIYSPIPHVSLRFDEYLGIHLIIEGESGFTDDQYYINLLSSKEEPLEDKKEIFIDKSGNSDEFILELQEPDFFYNTHYQKNDIVYHKQLIPCFEEDLRGILLFSKQGYNLPLHERLPPDEIIIVAHQSNKVCISAPFFSNNTPNWPEYLFYIIPFKEDISIKIKTYDEREIQLLYSLITEPVLIGGNEIADLPILSEKKIYKEWPSLLIPLHNIIPQVTFQFTLHLYKENNLEKIEFSRIIDGQGNYLINEAMGYIKIDLDTFEQLTEYSSACVIFSLQSQSIKRDFSFNLVQELSIIFQPENNPLLYVSEDQMDIQVNIKGPLDIFSGKKRADGTFEIVKKFQVSSFYDSSMFPVTVTYQANNEYLTQFSLNLEIPILSFTLQSNNPLPKLTSQQYCHIEEKTAKKISIPVEYLYYNNFHVKIEVNLPSNRKGNCSLIILQPCYNQVNQNILLDEVSNKKIKQSSISFSCREIRDSIHLQLVFPLLVQIKYRERFRDILREQMIDLFQIVGYEIYKLDYSVQNVNKNYVLNLSWRENNRLTDVTLLTFLNKEYSIYGKVDGFEYVYNHSMEVDLNENNTVPIQFKAANKLIRTFPIRLSDKQDSIVNQLWELGCWKPADEIISHNRGTNFLFHAKHFHLLKYVLSDDEYSIYKQDLNNIISNLIADSDQNSFTYGLFLKILNQMSLDEHHQELQKKILTTKNNTIIKEFLALEYAYNHEYIKAKAILANKFNNLDEFIPLLYISYTYELLGKNLFAEKYFFEKAFTLLKNACNRFYYFIPFWVHLQHICELNDSCPDEIIYITQYLINRLSKGYSIISEEEYDKISRVIQ